MTCREVHAMVAWKQRKEDASTQLAFSCPPPPAPLLLGSGTQTTGQYHAYSRVSFLSVNTLQKLSKHIRAMSHHLLDDSNPAKLTGLIITQAHNSKQRFSLICVVLLPSHLKIRSKQTIKLELGRCFIALSSIPPCIPQLFKDQEHGARWSQK